MLIFSENYCYLTKGLYICRNIDCMKKIERQVKCPDCEGLGYEEVVECDRVASMCCGGCTVKYKCERCDGRKEVTQTGTEYELHELDEFSPKLIEWDSL